MNSVVDTRVNIPKDINIQLRRYVMEMDMKNKEVAIIYILKSFLVQFYGEKK